MTSAPLVAGSILVHGVAIFFGSVLTMAARDCSLASGLGGTGAGAGTALRFAGWAAPVATGDDAAGAL